VVPGLEDIRARVIAGFDVRGISAGHGDRTGHGDDGEEESDDVEFHDFRGEVVEDSDMCAQDRACGRGRWNVDGRMNVTG